MTEPHKLDADALIGKMSGLRSHASEPGCRCYSEDTLQAAGIDIGEAAEILDAEIFRPSPVVTRSLKAEQMVPSVYQDPNYLAVPELKFHG